MLIVISLMVVFSVLYAIGKTDAVVLCIALMLSILLVRIVDIEKAIATINGKLPSITKDTCSVSHYHLVD